MLSDEEACRRFFAEDVSERIRQSDGAQVLSEYLADIALTGFDDAGLGAQVEAPPLPLDWEIGEVVGELLVERQYDGEFPWPTSLDRRAKKASLPGPDLAGFRQLAVAVFALGEVKSSSESQHPPQVVTKAKDGLATQMKLLANDRTRRQTVIEWLTVKGRDSDWSAALEQACREYYGSPSKAWLIGVLVRGNTEATVDDLRAACEALEGTSYDITLAAFHIPFDKEDWPSLLAGPDGDK